MWVHSPAHQLDPVVLEHARRRRGRSGSPDWSGSRPAPMPTWLSISRSLRAGAEADDVARVAHERAPAGRPSGTAAAAARSASTPSSSSIQAPAAGEGGVQRGERAIVLEPRRARPRRGRDPAAAPGPGSSPARPAAGSATWLSSGTTWPLTKISRRALGRPARCGPIASQADARPWGASAIGTLADLCDVGVLPGLGPGRRDALRR